jgi:hypothetical protein
MINMDGRHQTVKDASAMSWSFAAATLARDTLGSCVPAGQEIWASVFRWIKIDALRIVTAVADQARM